MRRRFCLDRIEGGVAVCLCEDESNKRYEFPLVSSPALEGLADGTLLEATLGEDGTLCEVAVLTAETEARREKNKARLAALLARGKRQ